MEAKKKTSKRFSPEVRERAVQMVLEHQGDHASRWAAIASIAGKIGCTGETRRGWVRQAERDGGSRAGVTSDERARLKALERENRELRQAKKILRKASAYFAQAEFHRRSSSAGIRNYLHFNSTIYVRKPAIRPSCLSISHSSLSSGATTGSGSMKSGLKFTYHLVSAVVVASLAGCAPKENPLGAAMTECQLSAHNEIDGTPQDDGNREAKLGGLVNACLKGRGFKPLADKPGCAVETKTGDKPYSFVKASADCWQN